MSKRSMSTVMAFVLGMPIGVALVLPFQEGGAWHGSPLARYVSHPVEWASVVLFACAVGALLTKLLGYFGELLVFRRELLPPWEGKPVPVEAAGHLLDEVQQHGRRACGTMLGKRIMGVLEFVDSRRSANELDDQLRGLADNDDIALDGSYSLIRFITWAIPILGFLGTVLGITDAVSGVTPEVLENNLSQVTNGLGVAFDTTAVALVLTMVAMFLSFVVERLEQSLLERVNNYADEQLAHRFERNGPESNEFTDIVKRNTQALLEATEKLVQRQAGLWNQSLEEARKHWQTTGSKQQEQITRGLEEALDRTLASHTERLVAQEQASYKAGALMMDKLQNLSTTLASNAQQQQAALNQLVQRITVQTEAIARLTESGAQLAKLQQLLQQNLHTLAGAGAFEQAVGSLTAAIHLLTSRVSSSPYRAGPNLNQSGEAA